MMIASLSAALLLSCGTMRAADVLRSPLGVSYISGGVGEDSQDQLRMLAGDFNLKLLFVLDSGAFLSGASVTINDSAGRTVLQTVSQGPWLWAKVPAGRYQILAALNGHSEERRATIESTGTTTVAFRWASE